MRQSRLDVEGGATYLSNGCVKCDALQARHFEDRLPVDEEEIALSVNVLFDVGLAHQIPHLESRIFRWWFDEGTKSES